MSVIIRTPKEIFSGMFMLLVSIRLQKCHYKSNQCSIFHLCEEQRQMRKSKCWQVANMKCCNRWNRPSTLIRLCLMMFSKPETLRPQAGSLHWSWHSYRWGGRGWSWPHPPLLNNTRRKMLHLSNRTRKWRTFHKPHVSQSATDVTKMSLHNLC